MQVRKKKWTGELQCTVSANTKCRNQTHGKAEEIGRSEFVIKVLKRKMDNWTEVERGSESNVDV